ncbi:hypothetical protein [Nostoc commune]|uniref:hypothetical protein n=1 Tax=Nostoc commune TaxID=1178 RepID=UPI002073C119|nr:hypothetical protein [Nostoc commune]
MRAIAHSSVYATGLEWTSSSSPPSENFEEIPTITSKPYSYGEFDRLTVDHLFKENH